MKEKMKKKKKAKELRELEEHLTHMRGQLAKWKILREAEEKYIEANPGSILNKFHQLALDCCQEHIKSCTKHLERAEIDLAIF